MVCTDQKETLAVTWACGCFSHYLRGAKFHIETDHKPLVPSLITKLLDKLPPSILWFRLRLMNYDFHIQHVPGNNLNVVETLSHAPTSSMTQDDNGLQDKAAAFVAIVTKALPATDHRLAEIQACQERDKVCSSITSFCAMVGQKASIDCIHFPNDTHSPPVSKVFVLSTKHVCR